MENTGTKHIPDVYLMGAPNTGKSTLFAALCGRYAPVGNREGVTVEAQTVITRLGGQKVRLTDLPGIRSLPPQRPDEAVSMKALDNAPEGAVVVFVADATQLARDVALFRAVRETDVRRKCTFLLAVNGCDRLRASGAEGGHATGDAAVAAVLDEMALSTREGVQVVGISARKRWRLNALTEQIQHAMTSHPSASVPACAPACPPACRCCPSHCFCTRTADRGVARQVPARTSSLHTVPSLHTGASGITAEMHTAQAHITQEFPAQVLRGSVAPPSAWQQRLDTRLTRGPLGVGVLGVVFATLMCVAFGPPGNLLCAWILQLLDPLEAWLLRACNGAPAAVTSFLSEGLLGGVGAVLSFLPRLFLLWLGMGMLEDSGYLPRAARLAHPFMSRLGLDGEALIPLLLGFGCSVPAVLSTRTMTYERTREKTMGLVPLISCSARLPLFTLIAQTYFSDTPGGGLLFCAGMYLVSAMVTLAVAALGQMVRGWHRKGRARPDGAQDQPHVSALEGPSASPHMVRPLPPLRFPSLRAVLADVAGRFVGFLGRVGGVIWLTSLLSWLLLHTTTGFCWTSTPTQDALLFALGRCLSPVLRPLQLSHPALAAALIAGIGAKESILSVLAICLSAMETQPLAPAALPSALSASGWLTPQSALAFCLLAAFYLPCTAALGSLANEWPRRRRRTLLWALVRGALCGWCLARFVLLL